MSSRSVEIIAVEEECCGTDSCPHISIEHKDHTGWLKDGKLRCRTHEMEPLFECALSFVTSKRCKRIPPSDGHVHGPHCGHERVPHGNHIDYLVGSRLHHVVDQSEHCCERNCVGEVEGSAVVDHGFVRVRGRNGQRAHDPEERELLVAKLVTTDIFVAGICCPSETPVIHDILENLPGVESVRVTVMTKNVRVEHDAGKVSPAVLVSALNGAGLQASLGERTTASGSALAVPPFYVLLSGVLLLVSFLSFIVSELDWTKYAALVGAVVGCPLIVKRAWTALRRCLLDINGLMLIGGVGAIILQEYYEAGAIVFLFGISQWLEDRCMGSARNALLGLKELQPEMATSAADSQPIPIGKIEVGDLLLVRPGDRVPVDGTVTSGTSAVDESLLTGESKPVAKGTGDPLISGSINSGSGSLEMKAGTTASKSTIAQLAAKVEETSMEKSPTERTVQIFAKYYTPLVVLAAIFVAVLPIVVHSLDWEEWFERALVLLVTACPCALVISTPVTTICGISRAAQKSILIKSGGALETLGRLKVITFDKTGTLTEGSFNVIDVRTYEEMSADEVLNWAAAIEAHSSHPLAAAIVGSAAAKGCHSGSSATAVENVPGGGLVGRRDGKGIAVGNWKLMSDQGVAYSSSMEDLEGQIGQRGQKACFVAIDQRLVGIIVVADRVRATAKPALQHLRAMGLHLGLLTGDNRLSAAHIGEIVGLHPSTVHSSLVPEEKAHILEDYKRHYGPVGHVGDGINDSLALAASDVGMAMGVGGSSMAVDAADVAFFSNEISSIPTAIQLSKKVRRIIFENIMFAISVKMAVIILAFYVRVHLWHAVVADIGSSLLVITNGLRVLRFGRLRQEQKQCEASCCANKDCAAYLHLHQHDHRHSDHCCGAKHEIALAVKQCEGSHGKEHVSHHDHSYCDHSPEKHDHEHKDTVCEGKSQERGGHHHGSGHAFRGNQATPGAAPETGEAGRAGKGSAQHVHKAEADHFLCGSQANESDPHHDELNHRHEGDTRSCCSGQGPEHVCHDLI